jgi:hypothetical protein
MVLAYKGRFLSEAAIAEHLKTRDFGTAISNVLHLKQWRFGVELGSLTENRLKAELWKGSPVIARIWTEMLDYWEVETSHVVVVVGCDEWGVFLDDPGVETWPVQVSWNGFLAAWFEYNQTAVIIR